MEKTTVTPAAGAAARVVTKKKFVASRPAPAPAASAATAAKPRADRPIAGEGKAFTPRELDLFERSAKKSAAGTCPDCNVSLANVMCLGRKLRACVRCRGVWLPLGVVQTLDGDGTWVKHLGPGLQAAVRSLGGASK